MAASPAAVAPQLARKAYRRREVCELYGVSLHMVDRMIRSGVIRTRRIGERALLLSAVDVEREFGFGDLQVKTETLVELRDLLA